jgi:hypothetical protein
MVSIPHCVGNRLTDGDKVVGLMGMEGWPPDMEGTCSVGGQMGGWWHLTSKRIHNFIWKREQEL